MAWGFAVAVAATQTHQLPISAVGREVLAFGFLLDTHICHVYDSSGLEAYATLVRSQQQSFREEETKIELLPSTDPYLKTAARAGAVHVCYRCFRRSYSRCHHSLVVRSATIARPRRKCIKGSWSKIRRASIYAGTMIWGGLGSKMGTTTSVCYFVTLSSSTPTLHTLLLDCSRN